MAVLGPGLNNFPSSTVQRFISPNGFTSYNDCMDTQIGDLSDEQVGSATALFKLLADPTRLRIVWTLAQGERSVNDLSTRVGAQPAAASQHLAKLNFARIVSKRRRGTFLYFSIDNEPIRDLAERALFCSDHVLGPPSTHTPRGSQRRVGGLH